MSQFSEFLHDESLTAAIKHLLRAPKNDVCCAVAFWGKGSQDLLRTCKPSKTRIICNLQSGGTNPAVIEDLQKKGFLIKQHSTLHAKTYIADRAIVASANASTNGLGLQDQEQAGWLEAGSFVSVEQARTWFENLWLDAITITPADIKTAKSVFDARQRRRPTRTTPEIAFESGKYPLLDWYHPIEVENDYDKISKKLGISTDMAEEKTESAIEVYGEEDKNIGPYTWVLKYRRNKNGKISKIVKPTWVCLGGKDYIVEKARFDGENGRVDLMFPIEDQPPPPFEIPPEFNKIFCKILEQDKYTMIYDDPPEDGSSFFNEARRKKINEFWVELLSQFRSTENIASKLR